MEQTNSPGPLDAPRESGHCAAVVDPAEVAAAAPSRSNRIEVRNPILALPGAATVQAMPPDTRAILRRLFLDMRDDARVRAAECWRRHKAPMACYWKAVSVYSNHIARVLA